MSRSIVYIISQVSHSKLFEWTALLLNKEKYRLSFILMHKSDSPFESFLRANGFTVYRIPYTSKKDIPSCIRKIRSILKKEKPAITHTHLFEAGLAGSIAARLAGIPRRIHTRHDAMIHHDFHPAAVKYDRLTNRMSTDIIAITNSVADILCGLEQVPRKKVHIIHHGFQLSEYAEVASERITAARAKYLTGKAAGPVIGVVSRFIEWKGIQYVIPAFRNLLKDFPDAHLLLCNAQGPYEAQLLELLNTLPTANYTRVEFETDIAALYKLMRVFVHVPIDEKAEAFGQVYIEAMAAGIPSVVTKSGIALDCVQDGSNALCVPFRDSDAITAAVGKLLHDNELASGIANSAADMALREFGIEKMITELEKLYDA